MTYTTQAAHELIDELVCRQVRNADDAEKARAREEWIKAGTFQAWADSLGSAITVVSDALEKIEAEARLVPEQEEDGILTYAQRVVDELFPTQSAEFAEFFGLDAA